MHIPSDIKTMIDLGALFVVNHSGGKDSQAMFIKLRQVVPADQLLVIHAHLPEVEWPGIEDHIRDTVGDVPFLVCQATKTFFEMVEHRGMWPSPSHRQCTSDLKRGPIEREVRRFLKDHPEFDGRVVNCMGLRAQESPARSRQEPVRHNARNSKAGRTWIDWLPIHDMLIEDVFQTIVDAGQEAHWAYQAGMSRLSCCFCIMSNQADLRTAAKLRPDLLARYSAMERKIDHTFIPPRKNQRVFLDELITNQENPS